MDEGSAFEAAVDEFTKRTSDLIGRESAEDLPPAPLGDASSSPVHAGLLLDRDTARRYALSIGDDNPIYTDPTYARINASWWARRSRANPGTREVPGRPWCLTSQWLPSR